MPDDLIGNDWSLVFGGQDDAANAVDAAAGLPGMQARTGRRGGRPIDPVVRADAYADALNWASALTRERANPLTVIANAEPLFAFLAAATDEDDLLLRARAGQLQHANDDEREADDDGEAFALRAAVLYGAMTGAA